MEANFKADFERTMEFRELNKAVEREAQELQLLRQARSTPMSRSTTKLLVDLPYYFPMYNSPDRGGVIL